MTIRRADEADIPAIARLSGQLGYPSSPEQVRARLASLTPRREHAVLVDDDGGDVVGWIHVFGAQRVESDPFAEVGGLVVDEARRSAGRGGALLAAAEQWAAEQGYPVMRIRSNVVRADAHRFYEQRGYSRLKQSLVFAKPLGAGGAR